MKGDMVHEMFYPSGLNADANEQTIDCLHYASWIGGIVDSLLKVL